MAKSKTERNPDGTFAKGHSGGPGRPPRATEGAYMAVVMSKCDLDTWGEIVAKAVADAKGGDRYAREWLTMYLLGEPSPRHFAPRPSKVIAQQETGEDGVDNEIERMKLEKLVRGFSS